MLARSVALNVVGQLGSLAVGFVSSIVLARLLGPADRGLVALLVSVADLTLVVAGVGLPLAVLYFASREPSQTGALLGNTLAWGAALLVVLVPAFAVLHGPLGEIASRGEGDALVWALAAALVGFNFLNWTTRNQLTAQLRFGLANALVVASKTATLVGVLALVGVLDLGVAGALGATLAGSGLSIAASLAVVLRQATPRLARPLLARMLRYGARIQVSSFFSLATTRLDVLILQAFRPLASVGYYVVAQVVAELVVMLARAFQSSVTPLVAREQGEGDTTSRALRHHGVLAAAAVAANAVFGTLVILVGYGDEFRPALEPMLILLPGMWFLGTASVVAADLGGRGRPGAASLLSGLAAGATVVLDLALIPPFGVTGAAVASVLAYAAYGCASLAVLSRVAGLPVRELVVPTREDLAVYGVVMRRLLRRG